ncbi:MAG: adenosylcobinamide-GDP ribazoletransferase [Nocardioides sp.]|uniref:adenosylcobinamide-GDP ribazoletransferase n=1 Tax=Nocardioides sp. TaxID=35761 RepID=UPI0039E52249
MLDSWRLAVGTLTALPVRPPAAVDRAVARGAILLAPLAILPVAALAVGVGLGVRGWTSSPLLAAVLMVGVLAWGTRALHWDGLSDVADGLAASYDRERSLTVMRSGSSGPAGTVTVLIVAGIQIAALAALCDTWRGAALGAVGVCVARGALTVCCARGVPGARQDGLAVTFVETVPRIWVAAVWLVGAAVLSGAAGWSGVPWWHGAVAAALGLTAGAVVVRVAVRRLGGVTGDVFGAAVELSAAAILVGLA